jgi:TolB-like protein
MERTVGPAEVLQELGRILASRRFASSEKLSVLLRFLTEEALLDPTGYVTQTSIAEAVLGRGPEFDPVVDPAVRVMVSRLRRRLADYYGTEGKRDTVRLSLPKGTYSLSFRDEHGNLTLVADGLGREALLADRPRLLVTRFRCDGPNQQMALGLTDELIQAFTRFQELAVVSVQSALRWDTPADLSAMGGTPESRFRIDGSVRALQGHLRVNVRLTTDSGHTIWAQSFDRQHATSNVFEIQDAIVRAVVAAIGDHFGVIHRHMARASAMRPVASPGWYSAVLCYHEYFAHVTPSTYARAVSALEKSLRRNPGDSTTSAMLADLYATDDFLGIGLTPRPVERATALARESVRVDPTSQFGHSALAFVHFLRGEADSFEAESRIACELNPNNPTVCVWIGMLTALIGRWEEGLTMMRDAVELNPLFPSWYHIVPFMDHYRRGDYAEALDRAERFGLRDLFWEPLMRAAVLGQLGETERGASALQELFDLQPDFNDVGRSLMGRMVHVPEVVEHLAEGLSKAGWREPVLSS